MTETPFTLIDDERPVDVSAAVRDGAVHLSAAAVADALGVALPPEIGDDGIEIGRLAARLDRPLALDAEARVGYLGISAPERSRTLASLRAPDFTLPDLARQTHSLRDYRGHKVLLIVYGSW